MQLPAQIWLLLFLLCWSERSSRRMSRRLLEDTWRPWIFISLCPYVTFVIIMSYHILMSLQYAAKKLLNLLWICEFRFKCSMSSLAVVFFLRPFLWGILAFRIIVETVCKPFTLFHSNWETKLRYQGQLNHPTPRMTKKWLCCILPHVPWAPLHPTISPSLKRKLGYICYSFILFKIVCHFSMDTSQKHHYTNKPTWLVHLNIHSLLRMLQYLWHGRIYIGGLNGFSTIFWKIHVMQLSHSRHQKITSSILRITLKGRLGSAMNDQ